MAQRPPAQYQILVLHNIADLGGTLSNIVDYIKCFERYGPPARYLYHRITDPVTAALREIRFHAVIVESTALGACRFRPRSLWEEHKARWSFLAGVDAAKIAFPQDDYHESNTLDALFDDFRFDAVYSVIPDRPERLYPRSARRADIATVLTGYVDDDSIGRLARRARPFDARRIDVGQRVTMYSAVGGRHARMKGMLAQAVAAAAGRRGFEVDVSTSDRDRINGARWFAFLGDCRYVTGCEGGVSLWDPDGLIYDRVYEYLAGRPGATFEEVEQACFPGQDGRHVFSAVSPRLFEAAMMRCCQVQIVAPYLGVLKPFEHYIPVAADLSDVAEAVELMRDYAGAKRRIDNTYDALVATREFRYSTLVARVMAKIDELVARRRIVGTAPAQFRRLVRQHASEMRQYRRSMRGSLGARAVGLLRRSGGRLLPRALHPYVKQWIDR
jgi:hypothetical protein